MYAIIQKIIDQEARLVVPATDLTPGADLYQLGLTPYCAVRVLLALEREFELELPRSLLKRETLRSIASIAQALQIARAANGARNAA